MNNPNARNIIFRGQWAAERAAAERRNIAAAESAIEFMKAEGDSRERIQETYAHIEHLRHIVASLEEMC